MVIRKSYMDAAAKLLLWSTFDVNFFDAFSVCLQGHMLRFMFVSPLLHFAPLTGSSTFSHFLPGSVSSYNSRPPARSALG